MQSRNCLSLSDGDRPKPRGNYTGERLKLLRPETYRRVVELLAEPREHVSYREICRRCHVTDDTVKAVEQPEAVSIAARKQELMMQAARGRGIAVRREAE
jgi:tRNA(Met) C34 N-acetyltransferase TmcA